MVGASSRLAYSMGGALASWQMFPARPRHSSSVNLRDAQVVPRRGAVYFPRQGTVGRLRVRTRGFTGANEGSATAPNRRGSRIREPGSRG